MEQSPSWDSKRISASQGIPLIVQNTKVHYCNKSARLCPYPEPARSSPYPHIPLPDDPFCCRIHLWFRLIGGLQAKSMTSQRNRAEPSQDSGYALIWQRYDNNKMVAMRYYGNVMIFYIFNSTVIDWTCYMFFNIILPSTTASPKWSHSFTFLHQCPVYASPLPTVFLMYCHNWYLSY